MSSTRRKGYPLMGILKAANKHYPEGHLSAYFGGKMDDLTLGGDTLAEFIVNELSETYSGRLARREQVAEALRTLERAKRDLEKSIDGLQELLAEHPI